MLPLLVLGAVALAQSPLRVERALLDLPNAGLLADSTPDDGQPDHWLKQESAGRLRVEASRDRQGEAIPRLVWTAGTKASLCSAAVPVKPGATVRLTTRVRGEPNLDDVTALHLHIGGVGGELLVAKRRFDTGDFPWEAVEILATAPPGATTAFACFQVQMVKEGRAAGLTVEPLQFELLEATSNVAALPYRRVVLVTVETFRRDHVHAFGYPRVTTPNLDALVAEGASLDRHYAQAPYTHPSLASLVTGQYPTTLGFVDNIPTIGASAPTVAELMAQAGYVTAAFSSQYVLSNRYGLNRGFHYYRNHPNDVPSNAINDELIPFLAEHANDNLFTWVHYFDPHGPYRPPARFRDLFHGDQLWGGDTMQVQRGDHAEGLPMVPKYIYDGGKNERRHYVAAYDADIAWLDFELGRLVEYLRATSRDDTLLIVTADHGESMTDHERYFCHGSLYEHDIHVPFVAWGRGVEAGTRVGVNTQHVDVLPTLLDVAGVGELPGFAGRSLRAAIAGEPLSPVPFVVSTVGRSERLSYAVVGEGGIKAIVDRTGALLEAYDVAADPRELKQASGSRRREITSLVRQFRAWLKGKPVAAERKQQRLDDEDTERLKALGYIE